MTQYLTCGIFAASVARLEHQADGCSQDEHLHQLAPARCLRVGRRYHVSALHSALQSKHNKSMHNYRFLPSDASSMSVVETSHVDYAAGTMQIDTDEGVTL